MKPIKVLKKDGYNSFTFETERKIEVSAKHSDKTRDLFLTIKDKNTEIDLDLTLTEAAALIDALLNTINLN